MSTSESDSSIFAEEDEEGRLYQWILEMSIRDDNMEETEKIQIASSSEHTPEHLEINAERHMTHVAGNIEALDMDELENIQEDQEQNLKVKSSREKPWRESGANVSDYFNYGFDEESWFAYCQKQTKIHAVRRELQGKSMAQERQTGHREEESSCACSPSGGPSIVASRDPHAATAEFRGQPRSRNRDNTLNITQVDTEMSHKEDSITAYNLPPPSNINYPFAYVSPPSSLFLSRPSPPSPPTIFDRHSNDFDGPLTSLYARSSGRIATRAGVIDTTKAWEYYTRHLKGDRHRDRSRERGYDKGSKRGRDREKKGRSTSYNSAKEQKKYRDTTERRHKRHSSQRVGGEKKRRDKSEYWQKTSQSSSGGRSRSRRDDGEDRESRHTQKKARRSRKGKKSNISADQERKLKSD